MVGKHTSGPWELYRHFTKYEIHSENDIVAYVSPTMLPEDAENLRLMAAAPDLLEALERIQHLNGNDYFDGGVCAMRAIAEAAIARATQPLPPQSDESK